MINKGIPIIFMMILMTGYAHAAIWHIGPSQTYTLPSQVKSLVSDGDTILIDGGVYVNDATKWNKANLRFIGLGTGENPTVLQYTGDIPNGKGIFVFESPGVSDNPYLENIVFDGAQVSDNDGGNGAGIRFQSKDITINHCKFMNCQNGILEGHGNVSTSNVILRNSEFFNNGYQLQNDPNYSGYEHNIYISASADTLIVENCYFHHPRGQGNSLKTRAQRSFILYNLIDEGDTGYGSWELNIAQGGLNIIMGNVIIQGPAGANHGIIGYDAATNLLEDFYFINNTVINQFAGNVRYFNIAPASGINTFKVYNNIFASVPGGNVNVFGGVLPGVLDTANNVISSDYTSFGFLDAANGDFALTIDALPAIDHGSDAGITNTGYSLLPQKMYSSFLLPLISRTIAGNGIDVGAYEFESITGISNLASKVEWSVFPNPSQGLFQIYPIVPHGGDFVRMEVVNMAGEIILSKTLGNEDASFDFDLSLQPRGIYFVQKIEGIMRSSKIIVVQ